MMSAANALKKLSTSRPLVFRSLSSISPGALDEEVRRFDPSVTVESAVTPPSSWFVDDKFHELDQRSVFGENWIYVGRTAQCSEPGQYFSGSVGREPFVVARDNKGTLRAFYDVCRHHAAKVSPEEGEGCVDKFTCPYHGWTYGLDGRLTRANRLKDIKDFKTKDFGLKPMSVAEWGPLVFVNADPAAESGSLAKGVSPLPTNDLFSPELKWVKRVVFPVGCNWKVFVDNYLDGGYHVQHLHKDLAAALSIDTYKTDVHETCSVQTVTGAANDPRVGGERSIYAYLFPNFMLNRYGPWLDTNAVVPTGPRTCSIVYDYFLEASVTASMSEAELEKFVGESLASSGQVQAEDTMICQSVQRGLESSGYDVGRYAPRVEMADHAFHARLATHYRKFLGI